MRPVGPIPLGRPRTGRPGARQGGRPPQVVLGGGGTELSPAITDSLLAAYPSILPSLGVAPEDFVSVRAIDFGLIEAVDGGWRLTLESVPGGAGRSFTIASGAR